MIFSRLIHNSKNRFQSNILRTKINPKQLSTNVINTSYTLTNRHTNLRNNKSLFGNIHIALNWYCPKLVMNRRDLIFNICIYTVRIAIFGCIFYILDILDSKNVTLLYSLLDIQIIWNLCIRAGIMSAVQIGSIKNCISYPILYFKAKI